MEKDTKVPTKWVYRKGILLINIFIVSLNNMPTKYYVVCFLLTESILYIYQVNRTISAKSSYSDYTGFVEWRSIMCFGMLNTDKHSFAVGGKTNSGWLATLLTNHEPL